MYIVIAPYSRQLRNGNRNPKDYPFWPELIKLLEKDYKIIQIGHTGESTLVKDVRFNQTLPELKKLIQDCAFWVSIDSFLPHLAYHVGKPGVVIWGVSDPNIFGYPENLNIIKDRKYLRSNQFDVWETQEYKTEVFLPAIDVYRIIKNNFP